MNRHRPQIALAHDYLTQRGGAERVVLALHHAFPDAIIHTTLYDPDGTYPEFRKAEIVTSRLNRWSLIRRNHRLGLPLLRSASESIFIDADVVIVSSSGWGHGFRTNGRRLVFCHSPARWLYQTDTYLGGPAHRSFKGLALLALRKGLTRWDQEKAGSADRYLAVSRIVRDRIAETYGIDAPVVPSPVSVDADGPQEAPARLRDWADGYHLVVSRLLPYKNVDKAVEAISRTSDRLVVVGSGPLAETLRAREGDKFRLLMNLTDNELRWTYAHAWSVIAPSYEDFGLTPLEGGVFGKPTIALRGGGYLDTVAEGVSGLFFESPDPESIRDAIRRFHATPWDPGVIRQHAASFSEEAFIERIRSEVAKLLPQPAVTP